MSLKQLSLKNKPITLYIAIVPAIAAIISGTLWILYIASLLLPTENDGFLFLVLIVALPQLLFNLVQVMFFVAAGILILGGAYKWSKIAIILAAIYTPLAAYAVVANIAVAVESSLDLTDVSSFIVLIAAVILPVATFVIAYNDIKYRLPKQRVIPAIQSQASKV